MLNLIVNITVLISQFADDATLIVDNIESLRAAINIVNAFGAIFGLQLNRKKQKLCGLVLQAKIRQRFWNSSTP